MKRFLTIALAVLVGVSLVTTVFAQATPEKPGKADTDKGKGKALGKEKQEDKKGAAPATPASPTPGTPGAAPAKPATPPAPPAK